MKNFLSISILFIFQSFWAQIPEITYQDFGYQRKVAKVEIVLYDVQDKLVLDNQKEEFIFNDDGTIKSIKTTDFSDNSTFLKEYFYKEKLLTSILETHSKRKEFTTKINFIFNNENDFSKIIYDKKDYKDVYAIFYNKDKSIQEIHGQFQNSYQYEKYEYDENKVLWKKELAYYEKDTVSLNSAELYIDNKIAADFSSSKQYLKFYTYSDKSHEISRLKINNADKVANEFLNLADMVDQKNMTTSDFRTLILGIKDVKVITKETFLKNEFGDWIINYYYDNLYSEITQYYFKKITYADGTISGDTEFDIFKVNEVKALVK